MAARSAHVTDRVVPRLRSAGIPVPEDRATLVKANAATQVVAASALATGRMPRLSAGVLAASLVPTTIGGHAFWQEDEAASKQQQRLQFAKNVSVLGGLLLAAVDTDGKPGVAWRTRHLARGAAREGRHLAKETRLQAKLAAKSV
ncbi:hypothetical protein K8W59_12860 [Nocardioides rotundus]|uniref:DoxX family protein n=1 Tax=Nocardioides rotundus TaxID=1774216 RepID=UPI001CBBF91C|nr:DoxX family protein [Nocardioides rotundus]UAL28744.1 hypothetical protein K8W59_12860 [Nocardioides rotundus]